MATATFSELEHRYEIDGELVPSVTQVLSLAGISDVSGIPAHILERARDIGTQVHVATELLDQDDLDIDSLDPQIIGYVAAYQKFRTETSFTPDFIEHRGVSQLYRYGFCIDRIGQLEGKATILDLKTSSRPQKSWQIQTAAYALGLGQFSEYERAVVHLAKDGTYKLLRHEESGDDSIWSSALIVAHWKLKNGTKLKD